MLRLLLTLGSQWLVMNGVASSSPLSDSAAELEWPEKRARRHADLRHLVRQVIHTRGTRPEQDSGAVVETVWSAELCPALEAH